MFFGSELKGIQLFYHLHILFPPGISNYKRTQIGLAAHIVSTQHFQFYTWVSSDLWLDLLVMIDAAAGLILMMNL